MRGAVLLLAAPGLAILAGLVWYNRFPTEAAALAAVPGWHSERHPGAETVACRTLAPVRQEEREWARFWFGCADAATPDGAMWVYAWHTPEDGRHFSKPNEPVDLKESGRWNR